MPGRYRNNMFLDEFKESMKYVGSFSIIVPIAGRQLEAMVRPSDDKSFYTVVLNNTFFGHLTKDLGGWQDTTGKRSETISLIGSLIEENFK